MLLFFPPILNIDSIKNSSDVCAREVKGSSEMIFKRIFHFFCILFGVSKFKPILNGLYMLSTRYFHAYCVGSKSMYCSDMHVLTVTLDTNNKRYDDYTLDNHRFNAIHIRAYAIFRWRIRNEHEKKIARALEIKTRKTIYIHL